MKSILVGIVCVIGLVSFTYQTGDVEAIVNAFKAADANRIGSFLDDYVDMKLLDKDEVKNIGRNQATITLKAFFADNGIVGFEKVSEREIGNTMYLAGKLLDNGKGHNITILLKQKDGKRQIITLRIN
ncbi:MAG TPA: DUF4783 domain-containing protein [Sediminibacterium sp.]|nr:DUF4783 domain-containing protein [Sediminibacterium sp.]